MSAGGGFFVEGNTAGITNAKPKGFPYHSHAGGGDSSASVFRRLMGRVFPNWFPMRDTTNNQPTSGANVFAFLAHYVPSTTFIGNAVHCGAPPDIVSPPLYVSEQWAPVEGLGGLINADMLNQPLGDDGYVNLNGLDLASMANFDGED